jgi:hypothetical protein
MDEVRVTDEEIRISGSKSVLARCTAQGVAEPVPKVLSFVQEWRAREDSNHVMGCVIQPEMARTINCVKSENRVDFRHDRSCAAVHEPWLPFVAPRETAEKIVSALSRVTH